MKTKLIGLALVTTLFAACAYNNTWDSWDSKTSDEQTRLQNQTANNALMTVVDHVDVDDVTFIKAIKVINEADKTECMPAITVEFDERPVRDYARNPQNEIQEMENATMTIHDDHVNLAYVIDGVLNNLKKGKITIYGRYYSDKKIEILPIKYYSLLRFYNPGFKVENSTPETLASFLDGFNAAFEVHKIKPKLYVNLDNSNEKSKILNQKITVSRKDNTIYEMIYELKQQLNLNCYIDDDGNLGFEPKQG